MEKDEGIGVSELEIVTGRKELEDEGTPDKIKNNENTNKQIITPLLGEAAASSSDG